jgi:hypothetical protein
MATDRLLLVVRRRIAHLWRQAATGAATERKDWTALYQDLLSSLARIVAERGKLSPRGASARCLQ